MRPVIQVRGEPDLAIGRLLLNLPAAQVIWAPADTGFLVQRLQGEYGTGRHRRGSSWSATTDRTSAWPSRPGPVAVLRRRATGLGGEGPAEGCLAAAADRDGDPVDRGIGGARQLGRAITVHQHRQSTPAIFWELRCPTASFRPAYMLPTLCERSTARANISQRVVK
jgi:hypothetical protein